MNDSERKKKIWVKGERFLKQDRPEMDDFERKKKLWVEGEKFLTDILSKTSHNICASSFRAF